MDPPAMVKDPHKNWADMSGGTDAIRKVNGYLSDHFIGDEVPADECLFEAQIVHDMIASRVDTPHARSLIANYLHNQFLTGSELKLSDYDHLVARCYEAVTATHSE